MKISKHCIVGSLLVCTGILGSSFKAEACSGQPYLGSICAFGGNFAIRGFAKAEGQLLPINQYQALFSLYGTTYGGDGRTTFALPDLRGRSPIGAGQGAGLQNIPLGGRGGVETITMTVNQMPSHTHVATTTVTAVTDYSGSTATLRALASTASTISPTGAVLANSPRRQDIYNTGAPSVDMSADSISLDIVADTTYTATTTVQPQGNQLPIQVRSPYLGVTWLVSLTGIFPSRD